MHTASRNLTLDQFRRMNLRGGGPSPDFATVEHRYGDDGKTATVEEYRSEAATMQARLERAARLLGVTIDSVIKRYGGNGSREERVQQAVETVEKDMGPEYRTTGIAYDDFMGGTGVHLAKPLDLETMGLHNQDTDNMLYAVKRFKRKVQEGLDNTKRSQDQEEGMSHTERPSELVRSCATAGPGWVPCDPLKGGECPPKELLVGTPYENVFSAEVGIPPNNKAMRCVPKELKGSDGEERKDRSLNKRLYDSIRVIARESANIKQLAQWKTAAPCDAIPATALQAHQKTCDSMFFKGDDRMPHRCVPAKVAQTLVQDPELKAKAKEAVDDPEKNTCFENPQEYGHELQRQLFRIRRLRHSLQVAAEDAMKVSNFRNSFNRIAKNSTDKYSFTDAAKGQNNQYTWGHVSSYILDDSKSGSSEQVDDIRKAYQCDDAVKELKEQNRRLRGGGDNDEDDTQLAEELSQLLTGGSGECLAQGADCDNRLMRVIKILHRLYKAEHDFMDKYKHWRDSYKGMLHNIEKDVDCRRYKQNPNMCTEIDDLCPGFTCNKTSKEDADKNCIELGNEVVDKSNRGVTWDVDKFDDNAYPVGFRYLVDSNLRSTHSSMEASQLRSCAAHSRTNYSDLKRLTRQFEKHQQSVYSQIKTHYPSTYRYFFDTISRDAEDRDRSTTYGSGPLNAESLKALMREVMQEHGRPTLGAVEPKDLDDSRIGANIRIEVPRIFDLDDGKFGNLFITALTDALTGDSPKTGTAAATTMKAQFQAAVEAQAAGDYKLKAGGGTPAVAPAAVAPGGAKIDVKKLANDIARLPTTSNEIVIPEDKVMFVKQATMLKAVQQWVKEFFDKLKTEHKDLDKVIDLLRASVRVYIVNLNRPVGKGETGVGGQISTVNTEIEKLLSDSKAIQDQNTTDWKKRIETRQASEKV